MPPTTTSRSTPDKPADDGSDPFPPELSRLVAEGLLSDFLSCSPYSAFSHWDRTLRPRTFLDMMYVDTAAGSRNIETIVNAHAPRNIATRRVIDIVGDRGSGKTSFLHRAFSIKERRALSGGRLWTKQRNCYVIDFELPPDSDNAPRVHADAFTIASTTAENALKFFIADSLISPNPDGTIPLSILFGDLFPNTEDRRRELLRMTPNDGSLARFFDQVSLLVPRNNLRPIPTRSDIQDHLKLFTLSALIYLAGFTSVASCISRDVLDDVFILFDNVDCLKEEAFADNVFRGLWTFSTYFPGALRGYVQADAHVSEKVNRMLNSTVYLFAVRATTRENLRAIAATGDELLAFHEEQIRTTGVYPSEDILSKRLDLYLKSARAQNLGDLEQIAEALSAFSEDQKTERTLSRLFNGNTRMIGMVLALAAVTAPADLKAAGKTLASSRQELYSLAQEAEGTETVPHELQRLLTGRINLSRGVLWCAVFGVLERSGFQPGLHLLRTYKVETAFGPAYVPTTLMALIYLHNVRLGIGDHRYETERGVRIDTVLADFNQSVNPGVLHDLADGLWKLYWREENTFWSRLLRIDQMRKGDDDTLHGWANSFPVVQRREGAGGLPYIRISDAGEVTVDFMLRHFEFYSRGAAGCDGKSLFTLFQEGDLAKALAAVDHGIHGLTDALRPLATTTNRMLLGRDRNFKSERSFLESHFAWHSHDAAGRDVSQHYFEHGVFWAFRYIDDLRYVWSESVSSENGLAQVNTELCARLHQLLDLFTPRADDLGQPIRQVLAGAIAESRSLLDAIMEDPQQHWKLDTLPRVNER